MSDNTLPSFRPTSASSFGHIMPSSMSPLSQEEFCGTLPSTKIQACRRSGLSVQPALTGEVLTNPEAVDFVTGTRISLSILRVTTDWHGNANVLKNCLRLYIMKFYT
ncbi:hypothetical protein ARMGADRAFT_813654 [Armillaria gallica]|uniref:Uncharacterized protein n=1 Tax=Armillaria gallica TaxID=47427 RepID=A0A2H3CS42_ARMGA|nr:hypothetical protein ARMGADRAFT_813654 [Armillaria gallica]